MSCNTCGTDNCGCLIVTKGDKGDKGDASFASLPCTNFSSNSVTYVEAGRIIAGTDCSKSPFTAAKIGIYVSGSSVGSVRISSIDTSGSKVTLYENTNITSTSVYNIEQALQYSNAPLSIVATSVAYIIIEILNQTGGAKYTFINGASLYFQ